MQFTDLSNQQVPHIYAFEQQSPLAAVFDKPREAGYPRSRRTVPAASAVLFIKNSHTNHHDQFLSTDTATSQLGVMPQQLQLTVQPRLQSETWSLYWKDTTKTVTDCLKPVRLAFDAEATTVANLMDQVRCNCSSTAVTTHDQPHNQQRTSSECCTQHAQKAQTRFTRRVSPPTLCCCR